MRFSIITLTHVLAVTLFSAQVKGQNNTGRCIVPIAGRLRSAGETPELACEVQGSICEATVGTGRPKLLTINGVTCGKSRNPKIPAQCTAENETTAGRKATCEKLGGRAGVELDSFEMNRILNTGSSEEIAKLSGGGTRAPNNGAAGANEDRLVFPDDPTPRASANRVDKCENTRQFVFKQPNGSSCSVNVLGGRGEDFLGETSLRTIGEFAIRNNLTPLPDEEECTFQASVKQIEDLKNIIEGNRFLSSEITCNDASSNARENSTSVEAEQNDIPQNGGQQVQSNAGRTQGNSEQQEDQGENPQNAEQLAKSDAGRTQVNSEQQAKQNENLQEGGRQTQSNAERKQVNSKQQEEKNSRQQTAQPNVGSTRAQQNNRQQTQNQQARQNQQLQQQQAQQQQQARQNQQIQQQRARQQQQARQPQSAPSGRGESASGGNNGQLGGGRGGPFGPGGPGGPFGPGGRGGQFGPGGRGAQFGPDGPGGPFGPEDAEAHSDLVGLVDHLDQVGPVGHSDQEDSGAHLDQEDVGAHLDQED
ncbi:uncharacterized protein VTP21DRAFT_6886, partial [Calcarisporiella thermophila]|uniref:uncharacterized protein n=1 Tax=Calcarisporiella thermophila TaxID=911321 RepID=UPI003742C9F7